jgi:cellulose biosynthesis protein BcsQ
MKAKCIVACDLLVIELECKFLNHELMDIFWGHLSTILVLTKLQIHFCNSSKFYQMTLLYIEKTCTFDSWVFEPFSRDILDLQTFFFKFIVQIVSNIEK